MPPRQYRAESLLALAVVEVGVGIVGGEYRQLAVGIDIPGVKAKAVAVLVVVVHLLQGVKILERPPTHCAPSGDIVLRYYGCRRRYSLFYRGWYIYSRLATKNKPRASTTSISRCGT